MMYDHRTYTCRPGTIRKHLALYEQHGLAPQIRHLGRPVLHAMTEIGDVNSYVHIWAYESLADRTERRAAMAADPEWQEYVRLNAEAGYLVRQENRILIRSPFIKP